MTTQTTTINNYIQQVLLSQDTRTAQQMLTDLFTDCMNTLEREPQNIQQCADAYAILQAYSKLGLPWQQQFNDFLDRAELPRPELTELCCKPTKEALQKLILWHTCKKNPLLLNKQELAALVYEIVHSTAEQKYNYVFTDEKHIYRLYYAQNSWHWQDVHKQLTWKFKK